jgi:acyl-CoA dehydrogenase
MAWDFSTEPEFQAQLDWIRELVREEIEPLDVLFPGTGAPYDRRNPTTRAILRPLQERVKKRGLFACHLRPELGGQGYGQLKLALMYEILGRSSWAPSAFGCQAPDSGNAEILAHYGTPEQKRRFLEPLLEGEIVSTYAMTEPTGGSDPGQFTCRARRDGDEWVIDGEKFFASNYPLAEFTIVMCITNPDVPVHRGASMLLVPKGTPGVTAVRCAGIYNEPLGHGLHAYLRFEDCRIPADHLLGPEGSGFQIAQTRLGGGRIHHAMRTVGQCNRAFEMMCERALSRRTRGSLLAEKQAVEQFIADSWIEIKQFRLQVLHAAWCIDRSDTASARAEIAGVKVAAQRVLTSVVGRALHVHGALGMSNELPLMEMWMTGPMQGVMDGPSELHQATIAKHALKDFSPAAGLWPSEHLPARLEAARRKYAAFLEHEVANS